MCIWSKCYGSSKHPHFYICFGSLWKVFGVSESELREHCGFHSFQLTVIFDECSIFGAQVADHKFGQHATIVKMLHFSTCQKNTEYNCQHHNSMTFVSNKEHEVHCVFLSSSELLALADLKETPQNHFHWKKLQNVPGWWRHFLASTGRHQEHQLQITKTSFQILANMKITIRFLFLFGKFLQHAHSVSETGQEEPHEIITFIRKVSKSKSGYQITGTECAWMERCIFDKFALSTCNTVVVSWDTFWTGHRAHASLCNLTAVKATLKAGSAANFFKKKNCPSSWVKRWHAWH